MYMRIEDAKKLIAKDRAMSVEELVSARKELYDYLNTLVDLAEHQFSACNVTLGLNTAGGLLSDNQIYLKNLFQLHYLLNIKLTATMILGDPNMYVIHAEYHNHDFAQVVPQYIYDAIYKDISILVSEHKVFTPYTH